MKKNNVTETENIVVEPVMDTETIQAVIEDNIGIVPKNQLKKFQSMTLQQQISKIQFYQDMQKLREEARIKNSIPNRVKELFEKRNGTVEDAKAVLNFCTDFIDNFKTREIEKIDEQIARLEEMKLSLA